MRSEIERVDDEFADHLVACDEALAAGKDPHPIADVPLDSENGQRLAKSLACLKLLRRLHATQTSIVDTTPNLLGRFEIRRELGRGGYGVVFLAYDRELCREVALKVPRAEALLETGLRDRFKHEARAAAGLEHPHIVPVYEAGEVGPVCYIASAFCPGINLAEWLRTNREPISGPDAAGLVATLADAIEHAHSRGVLHRDLKPANVILQSLGSRVEG